MPQNYQITLMTDKLKASVIIPTRNRAYILEQSIDSPNLLIFPILRGLVKYHYGAKGVLEAKAGKL